LQYAVATPLKDVTPPGVTLMTFPGLLAAFDPSPLRPGRGYEIFYQNHGTVFFSTSIDLVTASPPVAVAVVPQNKSAPGIGSCLAKSIGRSDDGKQYVMLQFCESSFDYPNRRLTEGLRALVAADPTEAGAFKPASPDGIAYHDHGDQQLLNDGERQRCVASQVFFQNYTTPGFTPTNAGEQTLKCCDNAGCLFRRLASTRTSEGGLHWSNSSACSQAFRGDVEITDLLLQITSLLLQTTDLFRIIQDAEFTPSFAMAPEDQRLRAPVVEPHRVRRRANPHEPPFLELCDQALAEIPRRKCRPGNCQHAGSAARGCAALHPSTGIGSVCMCGCQDLECTIVDCGVFSTLVLV
jgi:hypothetical protein